MTERFIMFDIGANWGTDSLHQTKINSNYETWAFEPTPILIDHLKKESSSFSDRYHVIPLAVSDYNGKSKFNISGTHDWGCSSLNDFNEGLEKTWPGRKDFVVTEVIEVDVMRLDTWIQENNPSIDKIDFFHCDTQGNDLKVLKGMGKYINLIQNGVVECASNEKVGLYKENHTLNEMLDFLKSNNFNISEVKSNDVWSNEVNVFFNKR